MSSFQNYDKLNGTNTLGNTISDFNFITGLDFSVGPDCNLTYATANGVPVVSTTTDECGNTIQTGSSTAREKMINAVNSPNIIMAKVNHSLRSGSPRGGNTFFINPNQINEFINGVNNLDSRTLGYGMTFMHELMHSSAGLSAGDDLNFGKTGSVVDVMNTIRSELNSPLVFGGIRKPVFEF